MLLIYINEKSLLNEKIKKIVIMKLCGLIYRLFTSVHILVLNFFKDIIIINIQHYVHYISHIQDLTKLESSNG